MSGFIPGSTGFLLKEVIERLGVSQRQLAKRMGSTQDWLGRIHNGRNAPSWNTVLRIARALEVSVGVFAPGDPAREQFFEANGGIPADQLGAERRRAGIGPKPKPAAKRPRRKAPAA